MKYVIPISLALFLISCGSEDDPIQEENHSSEEISLSKSDSLIKQTIEAHGGELYETAHYKFAFRDKTYSFKNDGDNYVYTSEHQTDQGWEKSVFENGNFERFIEGEKLELSEVDAGKYGESLNSVIYFATLPHKLSDPSVHSEYLGTTTIKESDYETVKVTFSQEGGGEDFEDEYCYWINSENKRIDYFAYNYKVNGGGVRFRSAFNIREVDGVVFQDYINYSAEVGTPLEDLPELYQLDSLEEVSRIELVDVKKL